MIYKNDYKIYPLSDIVKYLHEIKNDKTALKGNNKGIYYYNIAVSFDIETSSFYRDSDGIIFNYDQISHLNQKDAAKLEKINIMYIWQFSLQGRVFMGRTWEEFTDMINLISDVLELNKKRRFIIYVQNLSYEFQFMRKLFNWTNVFSLDLRKPLYCLTDTFVEFRCSKLLSGFSLALIGKNLLKYKVEKLTGDLDYTKIRHSKTPLTELELRYCVNDVLVVTSYIQELIEQTGYIYKIPLTNTGFVRNYTRTLCLFTGKDGKKVKNHKYIDMISDLQINDISEFNALKRAFSGGFTHANSYYTGEVMENVYSFDFTSSYPAVMVAEKFPMSRGVSIKVKNMMHFYTLLEKYCCIFDIEFIGLISKQNFENPISTSRCFVRENVTENNGRVFAADRIVTTITNVDFETLKKFYTWEKIRVGQMYCYKADYLPTELINAILNLYEDKTKLKEVPGMEAEYLNKKGMLNSVYGMTVTNPIRGEYLYEGDIWGVGENTETGDAELLYKHNTSKKRFLFYPWGVFVTAYARKNLFTGILECKNDYIYSDTDSIKLINYNKHKKYFNYYNIDILNKLKNACDFHGINIKKCAPDTKTGKIKPLGVWDYEGKYTRFKTLGAKRYLVEKPGALWVNGKQYDVSLTVSGVNKNAAIPYLSEKYGDVFDAFSNYLKIPKEHTGKMLHTYIDSEKTGVVCDYLGDENKFFESSAIHLEPVGYHLSLSVMYLDFLNGRKLME